MNLYKALAAYRNEWVLVHIASSEYVFHGLLEEVRPDYIKIKTINDDGERVTNYLAMPTICRFSPDSPQLMHSQIEAMYNASDDGEDKERATA